MQAITNVFLQTSNSSFVIRIVSVFTKQWQSAPNRNRKLALFHTVDFRPRTHYLATPQQDFRINETKQDTRLETLGQQTVLSPKQ